MKQTFLFVDAADILRTGAFDLHVIFTERKVCQKVLLPVIFLKNSENYSYSRAVLLWIMLITGSMFWP